MVQATCFLTAHLILPYIKAKYGRPETSKHEHMGFLLNFHIHSFFYSEIVCLNICLGIVLNAS